MTGIMAIEHVDFDGIERLALVTGAPGLAGRWPEGAPGQATAAGCRASCWRASAVPPPWDAHARGSTRRRARRRRDRVHV